MELKVIYFISLGNKLAKHPAQTVVPVCLYVTSWPVHEAAHSKAQQLLSWRALCPCAGMTQHRSLHVFAFVGATGI